jgi:hypothetical protein
MPLKHQASNGTLLAVSPQRLIRGEFAVAGPIGIRAIFGTDES